MTITLTLADIGYFIVFVLVVLLCVYLITILYRFNQTLKEFENIFTRHGKNIDESIENIAGILENVNDITAGVADGVEVAGATIDSVSSSISETAASFQEKASGVAGYWQLIKIIIGIIRKFNK